MLSSTINLPLLGNPGGWNSTWKLISTQLKEIWRRKLGSPDPPTALNRVNECINLPLLGKPGGWNSTWKLISTQLREIWRKKCGHQTKLICSLGPQVVFFWQCDAHLPLNIRLRSTNMLRHYDIFLTFFNLNKIERPTVFLLRFFLHALCLERRK